MPPLHLSATLLPCSSPPSFASPPSSPLRRGCFLTYGRPTELLAKLDGETEVSQSPYLANEIVRNGTKSLYTLTNFLQRLDSLPETVP